MIKGTSVALGHMKVVLGAWEPRSLAFNIPITNKRPEIVNKEHEIERLGSTRFMQSSDYRLGMGAIK